MKTKCVFIFLFLLQTSCSSIKPTLTNRTFVASETDVHLPDNVDLNLPNGGSANDGSLKIIPNEETVRLGDHGGDIFDSTLNSSGTLAGNHATGQAASKKLRIGLSLGPGLFRAINYVSLLKFLERQSLTPAVVTGTDFGAIVAAMYASGMTPEVIEWNFYRYFKGKRNFRLYDEEWLEEVDTLLLKKILSKNIQDCPKKLYLTLYNRKTKKTHFFDKGNIRQLLLLNLKLTNTIDPRKKDFFYTSALEDEVFNSRLMKKLGIDFTIGADVLGQKFDFDESNEYLLGVFGKAAGRISREKSGFDYFYSIPLTKMNLDSTRDGASFQLKTQEYIDGRASSLKKIINQKLVEILKTTEQ